MNNIKYCFVDQCAGLGDIIFIQKIIRKFIALDYNVINPVLSQYANINEYLNLPYTVYWDKDKDYPQKERFLKFLENGNYVFDKDILFLPLSKGRMYYAEQERCMTSKYRLVYEDWNDWQDYVNIKRNIQKEEDLYYNVLGLHDNERYAFLNTTFGYTDIYNLKLDITTDKKIIKLRFIDGFTLFDWCKVLENASNIYTVETSIVYLIEKLNLKTNDLHLFYRDSEAKYQTDGLFKKPWIPHS